VGEGGKAWGNGKTFSVSWKWLDDQNRADSSGLTFSLKSTANPTKGTVKLLYRPLEADKTVANIPPYVHPPGSEVGDTQGDETVGEKDQPDSQDASADTDEGGPGDRGRGDREKPIDPNTLDPKNQGVGSVIREWISVAEPPENATEGAKFRYEKWGRKVGKTADGGTISATGKPDYALSSPEETVWSMRQKLDSVNHCTVEEYVVAKLEGRSLDNCRGRYKASPSETVERLTGLTLSEAKSKLARAGLKPRLSAGKPAPRKRDEGTIASQDPAPGTKLRRGNSVKLEVYGPYSSEIAIPGVAGLSVKEVKVKLEEKGLEVRLSALGPAPSDELSFRVKETEPKEGTKVKPGTEVTVKVFGKYTAPLVTVPKIAGLSVKDAKSRLQEKGLKVRLSALGPAPSIDLSFMIKESAPKAGTRVSQGTEVTVKVYGKYTQKLITVPRVEGLSLSMPGTVLPAPA
jgi:beta-lactam-binding protein with PASTA domain